MTELSEPQRDFLLALARVHGKRATVDDLCDRTGRRKTALHKLQETGYVDIQGARPEYAYERDERMVSLTKHGESKAAELAQPRRPATAAPAKTATPAAAEQPAPAAQATRPADADAEPGVSSESKVAFLARMYLGRRVKIYANAIPAVGTLTTVGQDFVHIVTNDGWDLVYDAADIEVTIHQRERRPG